MNIYSFLSLVAGTVSLFFAALVLIKGGASKQNRSFFIATVLTGIWTYFPFLISISPDNSLLVIAKVLYLSASFVPTAWFYFMMNILGLPQERKRLISLCFISGFFALASRVSLGACGFVSGVFSIFCLAALICSLKSAIFFFIPSRDSSHF